MTLAESRRKLVEWIGDQAPLADSGPDAWAEFRKRFEYLVR